MQLYFHETSGGAKYLTDTFIVCENGHREGHITDKTKYCVRIDGDITKDAELSVRTTEKERQKISVDLSEEDLQELQNGRSFDWTFPDQHGKDIDIHLFPGNPDGE